MKSNLNIYKYIHINKYNKIVKIIQNYVKQLIMIFNHSFKFIHNLL